MWKNTMNLGMTAALLINSAYANTPPAEYHVLVNLPNKLGWVLQSDDRTKALIVIRGTENIIDWLTDAEIDLVTTSYGDIHRGFWSDTQLILPTIYSVLSAYPSIVNITVTGHSLGAAIATIVSKDISFKYRMQDTQMGITTILYASPKPGDISFKESYNEEMITTYSFANINDVVPKVPEGFGYTHVCEHITFDDSKLLDVVYNHAIHETYSKNSVIPNVNFH